MSSSPDQPPQRVPNEPLRQIDWLAVAPWLILLRAPQATLGWPLVIGAIGSVLLGGFGVDLPAYQYPPQTSWEAWSPPVLRFDSFVWPSTLALVRFGAWVVLGLAIARLAASKLNGLRGNGLRDAVQKALRGTPATLLAFGGLLLPLALALLAATYAMRWLIPAVPASAYGLAIAGPLVIAPLTAGVLLIQLGWPIALGSVGVDNADAFDAASRCLAYTTQRLGRAAFYLGLAVSIGYAVSIPLELIIQLVRERLALALPAGFAALSTEPSQITALVESSRHDYLRTGIFFATRVLRGFYPAYFFSAATAIYLLLRQDIDGQPIDDVEHADA